MYNVGFFNVRDGHIGVGVLSADKLGRSPVTVLGSSGYSKNILVASAQKRVIGVILALC